MSFVQIIWPNLVYSVHPSFTVDPEELLFGVSHAALEE